MERCSVSRVIRKMQIKITTQPPTTTAKAILPTAAAGADVRRWDPCRQRMRTERYHDLNAGWQFLIKLDVCSQYSPVILLLGVLSQVK